MQSLPFITIGITTYNRKEMLVECVKSILDQSFSDFEVIIGNDYIQEELSLQALGIADPRVRIVNHTVNLGDIENMKYLLAHSSGEHFTWLADDDAYHPHFLRIAHDALRRDPALDCVFSSYWTAGVRTSTPLIDLAAVVVTELTTDQFLERYLSRLLLLIGCYGVFRMSFIKELGGIRRAGTGFGPYSDNILGIKAGVLGRVAYIDLPLIFYRIHSEAISCSSDSIEAYTSAQADFEQEFDRLVKKHVFSTDYARLKFHLFSWFVCDLAGIWGKRRQNLHPLRIWGFIRLVGNLYISRLPLKHKLRLTARTSRLAYTLTKQDTEGKMTDAKSLARNIIYLIPGAKRLRLALNVLLDKNRPDFSGWGMVTNTYPPWLSDDITARDFLEANSELTELLLAGRFKLSQFEGEDPKAVLANLMWRHYIVFWSARHCSGNLVEAGVCDGMTIWFALRATGAKAYLYDAWESMKPELLLESEKHHIGNYAYLQIEQTKVNLAGFPAVFNKGFVPESFAVSENPESIAWLHIDLDSAIATTGTLEFFYDKVVPGGLVLFNSYGWHGNEGTRQSIDTFSKGKGQILALPTGQAIFFKH